MGEEKVCEKVYPENCNITTYSPNRTTLVCNPQQKSISDYFYLPDNNLNLSNYDNHAIDILDQILPYSKQIWTDFLINCKATRTVKENYQKLIPDWQTVIDSNKNNEYCFNSCQEMVYSGYQYELFTKSSKESRKKTADFNHKMKKFGRRKRRSVSDRSYTYTYGSANE